MLGYFSTPVNSDWTPEQKGMMLHETDDPDPGQMQLIPHLVAGDAGSTTPTPLSKTHAPAAAAPITNDTFDAGAV